MLFGSSLGLPNSVMPHLFSILYTGSQLKKGLISNSLHFALNLWMVLPLPTSQILFTLIGTPPRQFRSSADTRVFRIPSFRTKSSGQRSFSYQAPTTRNKLPASIRHASSASSFKSSLKTFLFSKTFSSVLWGAGVCQGVRLCFCVLVLVHMFAVCVCEILMSKYIDR